MKHTDGSALQRDAALRLARHEPEDALLARADAARQQHFGRKVELCAIINTRSGNCGMDCRFCSQSRYNPTGVAVSDLLTAAEIRNRLDELASVPLRHVGLVTSGGLLEDAEVHSLAETLRQLPDAWQGKMCGSLGRLPYGSLTMLRDAGLTRFHHNLETAEAFYPQVCTTQRWRDRLATVHRAREAGLSVCCGGLFGLGETWEHRVDFALSLREQGVEEVPINFLHAHSGTPLAEQPALAAAEALRILAVFRLILPTATLRVCGGRTNVLGERQSQIFAAGANALMTGNYLTTKGAAHEHDTAMIAALGLEIVS